MSQGQDKGDINETSTEVTSIGTRQRKLTDKALWWQIDTLQKNFRRAVSSWKSWGNKIEILLCDTKDTNTIREHRNVLLENMNQVTSIHKQLTRLIETECELHEHKHLLQDIEVDLSKRYESCENENSELMKRITARVQEIDRDNLETRSKGSYRSGSGRSSHASSQRTNISQRSHAASRAAELKAKLKYIEVEAKAQLELKKIQTLRELEATEAKLEVLDKVSRGSDLDDLKRHYQRPTFSDDVIYPPPSLTIPVKVKFDDDQSQSVPHVSQLVQGYSLPNISQPLQSNSVPNVRQPVVQITSSTPVVQNVHSTTLNPSATAFEPQSVNTANYTGQCLQLQDLSKSIAEQVSLGRLPPPEPSVFYGDPLKYPAWKSSFQTLIEQRKIPSFERIHYLRKYVGDSVREAIENFLVISTEDAYDDAKELLEKRYGDPFIIGNAFRDRLESWPKIASRDNLGLRKFSDFLKQCLSAMKTMGTLNALNDDRENRKLLSKLPDWMVTRWSRIVARHKEENREFPSFEIFVKFVEKEATIANDPVTSIQSVRSETAHSSSDKFRSNRFQRTKNDSQRRNVLATETSKMSDNSCGFRRNDSVCAFCKKTGHIIDLCQHFLEKSIEDRKNFAKEKGLCFGCLGQGHTSRKCQKRKRCNLCSKLHPTPLHGDIQRNVKSDSDRSNSASGHFKVNTGAVRLNYTESSGCKSSLIVPVCVSHVNDPSNERLVYALLDTQSDTTFILENTCQSLGLSGTAVKLSLSTMHSENTLIDSCKIKGLMVRGYDSELKIPLSTAFTRNIMPANRSHIPSVEMAKRWNHLEVVAERLMPLNDCEFGLLIGYDCARALTPREVIPGKGNEPYALKTDLGWGIVGIIDPARADDCDSIGFTHRIVALEVMSVNQNAETKQVQYSFGVRTKEVDPCQVAKMMELDFSDRSVDKQPLSREDKRFLSIMQESIRMDEGHYEMPLPFKGSEPILPNDRSLALQRFDHLRKRLQKDIKYRNDYFKCMNDLIAKGYAERVESVRSAERGNVWYIPHHGVYHPQKPEKVRIMFDCSAKHNGSSLNDYLLQGPDLTNSLIGVLCRFRQESIALVCDIEQMFLQFRVKSEHRDYLRFLWFDNYENLATEPVEYRMKVHLFYAASSPGCANFGLKQIANDYESDFGSDAANFIRNDFYVDDGVKSVSNVDKAIQLVRASQQMCKMGGLRLHKFRSNSKDVLSQIDPDDRASDMKNIDILNYELPITKTLGVQWCIESDSFQFRIVLNDKPLTRRGILSTLSSVYDPLGFISPIVLVAKRIFQDCCVDQDDWDSGLSEDLTQKWEYWRKDVLNLKTLEIPRCVKPDGFGTVVTCELHHFSDASTKGYGQCSYLRLINADGQVNCTLLMSKARVVPRKSMTIPRLELAAALVSVRISRLLRQEIELENIVEWFWTDSNVVLGYISNESRRFHVFVSNRVLQILDYTAPEQWKYVDTSNNPADIASRGATSEELTRNTIWFTGPRFLWETDSFIPDQSKPKLDQADPEVRRVKTLTTQTEKCYSSILERLQYFSDWQRAKKAIAICMNLKDALRAKYSKSNSCSVSVKDMSRAEVEIIRHVQKVAFKDEIERLCSISSKENESDRQFAKMRNETMKQTSSLYKLDPFLDANGLIRVGGRIKRSDFDPTFKHPAILPRHSHITDLIIRHCHELVQHQGRGLTINEIRSQGYWIIGCSSAVSKHLLNCVICRKLRGKTQVQKMADLPYDRLEAVPPFTYCGVDLFGPFLIKEGRKELKRYGVLFTCLSSRAVHIETSNSLDTSSFINALRRFISLRGPVRHLRSDQGSNFVGAKRELREAFSEMDAERIRQYLLDNNCDYIEFKMNVPSASHMGGVWERQIRSIRNVLATLLNQLGTQLDDESLRTFLCEAASIVNSRPLTVENLNDPLSVEPITPNHLLTMKSRVILPPPGEFQRNDVYSRKRWRRVQYLSNQFWDRWRKEFLSNLQSRQKWVSKKRNLSEGDIVIIKDENMSRNLWHLGRISETYTDQDGLVRKAKITVGSTNLDKNGKRQSRLSELERPIHKLILLRETEEIPTEEPCK